MCPLTLGPFDFREVFSEARATMLPLHHSFKCAIDLLPGTSPPKGQLYYPLSGPEREAMDSYIQQFLAAVILRPSSLPTGPKRHHHEGQVPSAVDVVCLWPAPGGHCIRQAWPPQHPPLSSHPGGRWVVDSLQPFSHYEYLVMPFCLTNTPAVFQGLAYGVLWDMLDLFIFV